MQDLMKQIIDMDREARQITDAAQQEKVDSEKEVQAKREEIRRKYLDEARRRIAKNKPAEQAAAEAVWEEEKQKISALSANLDKLYQEKGAQWVNEILARVTGE